MKKKITFSILLAIVILSAVLRLWQFGAIPQGFQVDEAAFGYNAYSLLKTGKDEYGIPYPLTLRSYDDQKAALYAYVDVPFIALMGLTPMSVRMPTALLGIVFVLLAYLISLELTKDKKTALVIAALCALSPTLIFHNRIQSDPMLGTFLVTLGLYLYLLWIKRKSWLLLAASFASWGLSLVAYQSPRVFLLLFLPFLLWHFRESLNRPMKIAGGFFLVVLFLCVGYMTVSGGARLGQTSLFTIPEVRLVLEESIRESGSLPPSVTRVFHNKPYYYGDALVDNFFSYVNFNFLFRQTEVPVRESIQNVGILYFIELPFFLIGIYQIIRRRLRWGYFVLGWAVIVPIVLSPFISESPNIHRFLLAILPLEILVGFGIVQYFEFIRKKSLIFNLSMVAIPLLFVASLAFFLNQLFVHQPVHRPWHRSYPFEQLMTDLKNRENDYNKIVVTNSLGNSYMLYLFYNQYDPQKYHESGSRGNEKTSTLGKYEFVSEDCPFSPTPQVLFVDNGMTCVTKKKGAKLIKVINWGDNTPAFKLYVYEPLNTARK